MELKDLATRCQSCGMPVRTGNDAMDKTFWGTNADGTPNPEFCKFCFAAGAFVEPELSMADMIEKSVGHMTRVLKVPPDQAKDAAQQTIPRLGRWKGVEV